MFSKPNIAYFSMEIGFQNDIPTYAGGLGILAGDTLKSFADLEVPVVGVSLLYKKGYFSQTLDEHGHQIEYPESWSPESIMEPLAPKIEVSISGRFIKVQAWLYRLKGQTGNILPIIFLDTDLAENEQLDREITAQLYSGDYHHRLVQEVVLGIGGVKMLEALGFKNLETYHMNEGHASFLTLELLAKHNWDSAAVRRQCIFTTHTPIPAGHDEFPYDLAYKVMGHYLPWHIKELAGKEKLNMTLLALSLSRFANGVSQKHGEVSRQMFPDFSIDAITNGVHSVTWTAPAFQALFSKYFPLWKKDPSKLTKAQVLPDEDVWLSHQSEKQRLLEYIKQKTGVVYSPDILTIGFARRAASYKRGDLLFTDLERLISICKGKVQFVFAGKAHPRDHQGKEIIKRIFSYGNRLLNENDLKIVFLPGYNMDLGLMLTAGCDVWLNNPLRPKEASGTSGMKAVHNGVPNFSVLDGWWVEGCQENITGWAIGPEHETEEMQEEISHRDAINLYDKLENVLIPCYYNDRKQWINIMKNAISRNASYFNTHRMVKEYVQKAYQLEKVLSRKK